ncbi:DNA polymerase theta short isoform [Cavenderia fasciculata]|uniref:DNA-directed DNA polymerase n=1 Tax=Cavenderia fasciculata TaxID=261658 RepID=F4PRT6_CACFS|nr:DNA polymerase theta short isoform [Cavenderia fasciculata]EGG21372.1 DNA polymerase theta short isoform [Cavenderia fasciculata]|eukprot:XP_004359222.1 DNA polymerase theta short isoform [Cavenderia fasciculata]
MENVKDNHNQLQLLLPVQQQQQQPLVVVVNEGEESFQFDFSSDKSLNNNNNNSNQSNNNNHNNTTTTTINNQSFNNILSTPKEFIKKIARVEKKLDRFEKKYLEKAIIVNLHQRDNHNHNHNNNHSNDTSRDNSIVIDESPITQKRKKLKTDLLPPLFFSTPHLPPPIQATTMTIDGDGEEIEDKEEKEKRKRIEEAESAKIIEEELKRKEQLEQEKRQLKEKMVRFKDQLVQELAVKFPTTRLKEDELRGYAFKGFISPFPGASDPQPHYGLIRSKEIVPRVITETSYDWFKSLWATQVHFSYCLVYQSHLPLSSSPLLELVGEDEISFLPKLNHVVGICIYIETTGNIVYYLPLNNPQEKSVKYQVTKTGKLNHINDPLQQQQITTNTTTAIVVANNHNNKPIIIDQQNNTNEFLEKCRILTKIIMENPNSYKYLYNCRAQIKMLMSMDIHVKKGIMDPRVGAWLLDPDKYKDTTLDTLVREFSQDKKLSTNVDELNHYDRSFHHCYRSFVLMKQLFTRFHFNRDLYKIFNEMEMPLLVILAKMEYNGIGFDDATCQNTKYEVLQKLQYIEVKARLMVPDLKFSMSSKEDMSNILYNVLRVVDIPKANRGKIVKRHHSTKAAILEAVPEEKAAFPKMLIEWRKLSHHLLNYVHVLFKFGYYNPDYEMMRIYTTIMQTNVPTGRLAMTYPNLQSIANAFTFRESPISFSDVSTNNVSKASSSASQHCSPPYDHHNVTVDYSPSPNESKSIGSLSTLELKEDNCRLITVRIRDSFIPRKGYLFLSADYSQIELRILAHLSEDKLLLDGLNNPDFDFFKTMFVQMNKGTRIEDVTAEERDIAKELCYGILYGMGTWSLANKLDRDEKEARILKEKLYNTYRDLIKYIDSVKKRYHQVGYVETFYHRKRFLDNNTRDKVEIEKEKRKAVNSIPQGTAADIIKQAMISIDRIFEEQKTPALMVLQIHDELLFEVREDSNGRNQIFRYSFNSS